MEIFLFFNQRNGIGERESLKKKVNFEIILIALDLKLINSSIIRDNLIGGSDNETRERFESKLEKIDWINAISGIRVQFSMAESHAL